MLGRIACTSRVRCHRRHAVGYVRIYTPARRMCVCVCVFLNREWGRNINCDIVGDNCKQNCGSITSDVNHATGCCPARTQAHAPVPFVREPALGAAYLYCISLSLVHVWVAGWQRAERIALLADIQLTCTNTRITGGCLKAAATSTTAPPPPSFGNAAHLGRT